MADNPPSDLPPLPGPELDYWTQRYAQVGEVAEHPGQAYVLVRLGGERFAVAIVLLDDQGARDQVLRLTARAREQVEHPRTVGQAVQSTTGARAEGQAKALAEALDDFEARFTAQAKEVAAERQGQAERDAAGRAGEQALAARLDAVIGAARDLTAAAWAGQGQSQSQSQSQSQGQGQGQNQSGAGAVGQAQILPRALERLTRDLPAHRLEDVFHDILAGSATFGRGGQPHRPRRAGATAQPIAAPAAQRPRPRHRADRPAHRPGQDRDRPPGGGGPHPGLHDAHPGGGRRGRHRPGSAARRCGRRRPHHPGAVGPDGHRGAHAVPVPA